MPTSSTSTGNVVTLWMRTGKLIRNRLFRAGALTGVNPQQMHALFVIADHDGLTMKELADHLAITSPSATSLVNRLVRLKWVVRKTDPRNRRLVRVRIAAAGERFLRAKTEEVQTAMESVLSLLSENDRRDFARILANLQAALVRDADH